MTLFLNILFDDFVEDDVIEYVENEVDAVVNLKDILLVKPGEDDVGQETRAFCLV